MKKMKKRKQKKNTTTIPITRGENAKMKENERRNSTRIPPL
jgi:hypothetical protein